MENTSYKYVQIVREKTGLSYYAIAKKIGVTTTRMNQAKNNKAEFNDGALIKLAQIAQVPVSVVLAEKQLKKAKTKEESKFWNAVKNSAELAKLHIDSILCSIGKNTKMV